MLLVGKRDQDQTSKAMLPILPLTPRLRTSVVIWRYHQKGRKTRQVGQTVLGHHDVIQTSDVSGSLRYWCCPHSIRNRVYVMVACPSVCLSRWLTAATAANRFAAERPVGRRCWSIATDQACCGHRSAGAGTQQQMRVASRWEPTEARHRLVLTCSVSDSGVYGTGGDSHNFTETMLVWMDVCTLCDWQAVANSGWLLMPV